VLGRAEGPQRGRAADQGARAPHDVGGLGGGGERALGLGEQQPAGVRELQATAGVSFVTGTELVVDGGYLAR
jgi:hypothetical protein